MFNYEYFMLMFMAVYLAAMCFWVTTMIAGVVTDKIQKHKLNKLEKERELVNLLKSRKSS